ncbi:hypothetical protein A2765_06050 [Candidatus Kaiserbacteria bacterium RIFCSPHIGHO2_01_FULL_56_24]|uniref:VanZ-like domain-containing protein n=1 Tax=Candidatus Kaiserbacteria bacterium RIFCSPHIGHO2_01_FULL_56_24 TaxID=1798487 RepID=A0A1F6D9J3_9BACT|nr:MAG: hypothetical protein A2765_06050 [Candidatus Kaiserbacteria bacterium RIFCSPHIGHO2_01_FULL_56_24]
MPGRRLFFAQAALLASIAVVHIIALQFYLYWHFPLLNRIVHFAGGLWTALLLVWLLRFRRHEPRLFKIVLGAFLIGVAWEIFEVAIGMTRDSDNYALDTTLDLLMDTLGGFGGFFVARWLRERDTIISHEAAENHSS